MKYLIHGKDLIQHREIATKFYEKYQVSLVNEAEKVIPLLSTVVFGRPLIVEVWEENLPKKLPPSHPNILLVHSLKRPSNVSMYDKVYEAKVDKKQWIQSYLEGWGATITDGALAILMTCEQPLLKNELDKLSTYDLNITEETVELLSSYLYKSEQWGLSKALAKKDSEEALRQVGLDLMQGVNSYSLLSQIINQFDTYVKIKDSSDLCYKSIAHKLGWRSSYAVKIRLEEVKDRTLEELEYVYLKLVGLDEQFRDGKIDGETALVLAVYEVTK